MRTLTATQSGLVVLARRRKSASEMDRDAYQRHAAVTASFRVKPATLRTVSRRGASVGSAGETLESAKLVSIWSDDRVAPARDARAATGESARARACCSTSEGSLTGWWRSHDSSIATLHIW